MRVLHVITTLDVGGAETMLAKLLEQPGTGTDPHVVTMTTPGVGAPRIRRTGTPLHSLHLDRWWHSAAAMARLAALMARIRPDAVMGWMYHGHLAARLAAACRPRTALLWNVRHSLHDLGCERQATRAILRATAALSKRPDLIVYNSGVAAGQYQAIGFSADRARVIPNGFDCARFRPNPVAREAMRAAVGAGPDTIVIGMAARAHPMKDPGTLARAVVQARTQGIDIHLVMAGAGMDRPGADLARLLAALPSDRVTLMSHQRDAAPLLAGLDLLVLPSAWGEGFPNVVGEAMASQVPCVVTDVGDAPAVVGATGWVVPPRDSRAMAAALLAFVALTPARRAALGTDARRRITTEYDIRHVAHLYQAAFEAACRHRRDAGRQRAGYPAIKAG